MNSGGGGGVNPMTQMMMGMMTGAMGMPPMGMPPGGMHPMAMGMPPMGMSPGMAPPASHGDSDGSPQGRRRRRRSKSGSSSSANGSSGQGGRGGSHGSRRQQEPVRLEEVERFLEENRINEEASMKVRALSPGSQRRVIARPLTGDVQNPSKVMIARVRELQSQNERLKGNDAWSMWNGVMMGATPDAIAKYIEDNDLDESASRQLRSLPPHQQAIALRWDLSSYRNPSAKFMSMANGLGTSVTPRMPFPGMMPMPGMPMMPMGMRPMGMPMAMPGMPIMSGMPHLPGQAGK